MQQQIIIYEFEQNFYCLVYDQKNKLEYFLIDNSDKLESIYLTKVSSINHHNKLGFIEYATNELGVVNLANDNKLQAGSIITLQMTWLGDEDKRPKFSTEIKLVGRYVILIKNSNKHIFAKCLANLEQIKEIGNKYSNYGLIFRSAVRELKDLQYLEQEIKDLINKLEQLYLEGLNSSAPKKLIDGLPKYLQLLRNLENSHKFSIITNSKSVFDKILPYATLWQLNPTKFVPEYTLDIKHIQDQIVQPKIELSGIKLEIHKLSGINLIDINGYNKQLDFYKINYLATDEVVWQIKLRDLTGIILIDFIKNMSIQNKEQLTDKITRMFTHDWRHTKILGFTTSGIFELIRNK